MKLSWLTFLIYGMAVFRLSVLFGEDTGPFRVFTKIRSKLRKESKHNETLRKSDLQKGVACLRCESTWWGAAIACYAYFRDDLREWIAAVGDVFLAAMALSAIAIIVNRAFPAK